MTWNFINNPKLVLCFERDTCSLHIIWGERPDFADRVKLAARVAWWILRPHDPLPKPTAERRPTTLTTHKRGLA